MWDDGVVVMRTGGTHRSGARLRLMKQAADMLNCAHVAQGVSCGVRGTCLGGQLVQGDARRSVQRGHQQEAHADEAAEPQRHAAGNAAGAPGHVPPLGVAGAVE